MSVRDPFGGRGPDAPTHFRLSFYGALLLLREIAPECVLPAAYTEALATAGMSGHEPRAERMLWDKRLQAWEDPQTRVLPLPRLRALTGLDRLGITILVMCGLADEDARLGRATLGLLRSCWDDPAERTAARRALTTLVARGLVQVGADDVLHADPYLWEVMVGGQPAGFLAAADLPGLDGLILGPEVRSRAAAAADWLRHGNGPLVIRGDEGSGRRTLVRALARGAGLGVVEVEATTQVPPTCGVVAALLDAALILSPPVAGGAVQLGELDGSACRLALRIPARAAVVGTSSAFTLDLGVPDVPSRARHWRAALNGLPVELAGDEVDDLATAHRITGGMIRRIAPGAVAEARAAGRSTVTPADVTRAGRAFQSQLPGSLLARLDVASGWTGLVVAPATRAELQTLERRCRQRERLPLLLPAEFAIGVGTGIRALFTGPSGTGKTLSARLLAGALGKDLFRLDLSGVVNKYLGETEKNLDRVLEYTQALDAVLLIDEGDALLAQRTDVGSANDRYANLETNYLLQRLDSFDGIVVITTNAEQNLDSAFERRLDVVVDFPAPGAREREQLWLAHLPLDHQLEPRLVAEIAARCAITGGQIRNAVLHACLLALDSGRPVSGRDVTEAVRREFTKQGAVCPLRSRSGGRNDESLRVLSNG